MFYRYAAVAARAVGRRCIALCGRVRGGDACSVDCDVFWGNNKRPSSYNILFYNRRRRVVL